MSRVIEKTLLSMAVAVLVTAAASCRSSRPPASPPVPPAGLGDRLLGQLERRTDVRHVWLVVAPLENTRNPVSSRVNRDGVWVTEDRTLDRARAERVREKIVEEMAARVHVVDVESGWRDAASVGEGAVNAVLVARFDPARDGCVRVRARILDLRTREILAVADATME